MHQVADTQTLGPLARKMIDDYLALPVGAKPSCPYFNNRRKRIRSGLRVLKGKGTPQEIAEECQILALQSRVPLASLSTDKLKEFLVAQDLGVDCSGFAYHVLGAHLFEKKGSSLAGKVRSLRQGFVGKILARLRPAESLGVAAFADDRNSVEIRASEARPGDFAVFLGTGRDKSYNHMIVITAVDRSEDGIRLSYAHSYAWPSDGAAGHGVREGDVIVRGDDLIGGTWKEKGVTGPENYTHESAKEAKSVSMRRLKVLA